METPLNKKQWEAARLKFFMICAVLFLFVVYHVLVSIAAYHTDEPASIQPLEEQTTTVTE